LNHLIIRLKLKGVIQFKAKTKEGNYIYEVVNFP